jgi:hypothetical protein
MRILKNMAVTDSQYEHLRAVSTVKDHFGVN